MKKYIITLLALLTVITTATVCPSASAEEIGSIAVLGDSISEGYGLDENEKNYSEWLGDYFNAEVSNFAVSGKTTSQLIEQLGSDSEAVNAVKEADLICVSIGGNDLMDLFFEDFYNIAKSYSASDGDFSVSPEAIENMIVSISTAIGPAAMEAGKNTGIISEMIRELNPEAPVVFQTVYNPFESTNEAFSKMLPPLNTFASIYLASVNRPMMSNDKIICADIKEKFKGLCPYLTNMNELDIQPNSLGHFVIAEEIVQLLRISGNYSVFTEMTLPEQLPTELREETANLSEGEFRPETVSADATVMTETTAETSETTAESTAVKESETAENDGEEGGRNNTGIIVNMFLIAMTAVIVTVIIIGHIKRKRRSP